MKTGQAQASRSYHAYLINSLKDPLEAAMYLEVAFQDAEPELMLLALRDVAEAQDINLEAFAAHADFALTEEELAMVCKLRNTLEKLGFQLAVAPLAEGQEYAK